MRIENVNGMTVLYAEEGMKITNDTRKFFSDVIFLGKNDKQENYYEVDKIIWGKFISDESMAAKINSDENLLNTIEELKEKIKLLEQKI